MSKKKLHPSVEKFKEFVKANPKLIQEVRKGQTTWQELYEDWYLLGEEDSRWDSFRSEQMTKEEPASEKKSDWMAQILGAFKKMDANQIQHHIQNLSQTLGTIQGVLSQFQGGAQSNGAKEKVQPSHPFQFRKD